MDGYISIQTFTLASTEVSSTGSATLTIDVSRDGYTPLGVVQVNMTQTIVILARYTIGSDGVLSFVFRSTGNTVTVTPVVTVLYSKNI